MRALVVGLGSAGRRHAQALKKCAPDLQVIGLSRSLEHAESVDEIVHSIEAAVANTPSFAILAGPASTRLDTAIQLAREGVHLLLEKPISDSLVGVEALTEIAAERRITVGVAHNLRFFEPLRRAKEMIDGGLLGPLYGARAEVGQYLPDWRPGIDYRASVSASGALGGGALLELCHEIDYTVWMFGKPVGVLASLGRLGTLDIDVEDTVEMIVRFASGVSVSIHQDMLQSPPFRRARFFGRFGSIEVDLLGGDVLLRSEEHPGGRLVSISPGGIRGTYEAQIVDFLDAINSGRPPEVTLEDGIGTLRVVVAAREASAGEREMPIMGTGPLVGRRRS